MGRRGPAPKPTNLRLLHGDRPSRTNHDEPPAPSELPECPDDASEDVRAIWDYTIKNLIVMGIATSADRDALRCYCEAVIVHRRASAILAGEKLIVTGSMGGEITNPAFRAQRDAAATIRAFAGEFGFTPSARSEIRKGGASHGQAGAQYLNGG